MLSLRGLFAAIVLLHSWVCYTEGSWAKWWGRVTRQVVKHENVVSWGAVRAELPGMVMKMRAEKYEAKMREMFPEVYKEREDKR